MKMEDGGSPGVMPLKVKDTEDHQELLRSGREAAARSSLRACRGNSLCSDLGFVLLASKTSREYRESCGFKPPVCLRSFLVAAQGNEHAASNWCSGHFRLYENFK